MWSAPCDLSIDTARTDALFASVLQIADEPSAVQVRQAIDAATSTLGDVGCAAKVAQEFGEHPETAVTRMRWARAEVAGVFGGPGFGPGLCSQARPAIWSMPCSAPAVRPDLPAAGPSHAAGLLAAGGHQGQLTAISAESASRSLRRTRS